jgi:hypothetical protein
MNIKGKARGGPVQLAAHVQKAENESVRVVGIDGLMAQDIEGALMEMDALGTMLRTDKTLYHGIISPEPGKDFAMTEADWDFTRKAFLKGMGFEGQPYVEIEHEKFGKDGVLRLHRHIITALADAEAGYTRAIRTDHNFRKHEEIARHVERQLGHEHVQGVHVERFGIDRPERTATIAEQRAAERGGVSAKETKALGAELWNTADSGKALNAALEAHGWQLARGDKTRADGGAYFMAIDPQGEAHELRRMMPVKAAELYERMADVNPASLPSIKEAKAMQEARQIELEAVRAEHQAREAARGHVDDIRPDRSRDFAASQTAPEAAQTREAPAASSAPGQENTRATEAQRAAQEIFREARPAAEAPRVIHLGSTVDFGRAAEQIVEKGGDVAAGLADGVEKALGAAFDYAADFIAPPPPPTKDQVEQMQKAADERRQQEPAEREKAEQEARLQEILEQMRRNDQREREEARYDRWTGRRIDRGDDRDDDYDRGRERERSR